MAIPFRALIFLFALVSGLITSYSVFAEELYDRLDGRGASGVRIDVIEWEDNLEIHAYPKGSMKGLSAKLDDRTEGKKVMVIGYRFEGMKTPLVRRAILGIPMSKNFKGYVDTSPKDYDKLAISIQSLTKPWNSYQLEAAPKQWYPEGDPRNEEEVSDKPVLSEKKAVEKNRAPSSVKEKAKEEDSDSMTSEKIKSFSW